MGCRYFEEFLDKSEDKKSYRKACKDIGKAFENAVLKIYQGRADIKAKALFRKDVLFVEVFRESRPETGYIYSLHVDETGIHLLNEDQAFDYERGLISEVNAILEEFWQAERSSRVCPVCGEGKLTDMVGDNEVYYDGGRETLQVLYSNCDSCGVDFADNWQMSQNAKRKKAWRESKGIEDKYF